MEPETNQAEKNSQRKVTAAWIAVKTSNYKSCNATKTRNNPNIKRITSIEIKAYA